jgi:hypothetical protein
MKDQHLEARVSVRAVESEEGMEGSDTESSSRQRPGYRLHLAKGGDLAPPRIATGQGQSVALHAGAGSRPWEMV